MIVLDAKEVEFFSENDELYFFTWLKSIEAVRSVEGRASSICISVENVEDSSLRELIALFKRYSLDMAQLSALKTPENSNWFLQKTMFWYDQVFGTGV